MMINHIQEASFPGPLSAARRCFHHFSPSLAKVVTSHTSSNQTERVCTPPYITLHFPFNNCSIRQARAAPFKAMLCTRSLRGYHFRTQNHQPIQNRSVNQAIITFFHSDYRCFPPRNRSSFTPTSHDIDFTWSGHCHATRDIQERNVIRGVSEIEPSPPGVSFPPSTATEQKCIILSSKQFAPNLKNPLISLSFRVFIFRKLFFNFQFRERAPARSHAQLLSNKNIDRRKQCIRGHTTSSAEQKVVNVGRRMLLTSIASRTHTGERARRLLSLSCLFFLHYECCFFFFWCM